MRYFCKALRCDCGQDFTQRYGVVVHLGERCPSPRFATELDTHGFLRDPTGYVAAGLLSRVTCWECNKTVPVELYIEPKERKQDEAFQHAEGAAQLVG